MKGGEVRADIRLPEGRPRVPDVKDMPVISRDTLKVTDLEGRGVLIMRAVRDEETGEMVATEQLTAAVVTARFRNVAERHGKVDIEFQVFVPKDIQESRWQLRLHPDMLIMGDSLRLDDVLVTGENYRKAQLRGYQQYERFLNSIVTDTSRFVDLRNLEIFLKRNIPEIYAFRTDSSEVSDEVFMSHFGVTEQEAVYHYTNKLLSRINRKKIENRTRKWEKYVKSPILYEGIRLDTVVMGDDGDMIYNYVQTVNTRKGLRKVDIVMSGEVFEQDRKVFAMPASAPLTFYISSFSTLVDNTERYRTKIIGRTVSVNTTANIEFEEGRWDIDESLGNNREEMAFIEGNLRKLVINDEFDLDSISVISYASPEGKISSNNTLCLKRARSASDYFGKFSSQVRDSLAREEGYMIRVGDDFTESRMESAASTIEGIGFMSHSGGENWAMLDELMAADTIVDESHKTAYREMRLSVTDLDELENELSKQPYYRYMRSELYPRLRTVRFDFALHRKGMVKDTLHTTELDSLYARGVQAIRDRDYETAVSILRPYQDYNTAVAYVSLDYNKSAMSILQNCARNAKVDYLLAVLYSRDGDDQNAVQYYLDACRQDPSYINRGNLDPEISVLIKKYDLNAEPDDDLGDLTY